VLGAVLHALRDRLQIGLAVHLGAQLPLLVRGLYYDQWHRASRRSSNGRGTVPGPRIAASGRHSAVSVKDATHVTLQVPTITSIRTRSRKFGKRCRRISALVADRDRGAALRTCRLTGRAGQLVRKEFQSASTREENCHASQ